jgi:hypothetical protein
MKSQIINIVIIFYATVVKKFILSTNARKVSPTFSLQGFGSGTTQLRSMVFANSVTNERQREARSEKN